VTFLSAADALARDAFEHPVHEQKRVAVRQELHNRVDIKCDRSVIILFLCGARGALESLHPLEQRFEIADPRDLPTPNF